MAQLDSEAQFRSPQIPDATSILESNGERQTEEFPAEEFPAEQVPVEQYPPVVPFPRDSNSAVQRGNGNVPLTGPSPSQPDSFVPRESTPSGFVPVRPQTELTLDAEDLVGEFQLDVPSRNKEEEKLLLLLRSEEVDKAFEATRNREGSELIKQFYYHSPTHKSLAYNLPLISQKFELVLTMDLTLYVLLVSAVF